MTEGVAPMPYVLPVTSGMAEGCEFDPITTPVGVIAFGTCWNGLSPKSEDDMMIRGESKYK